MKLDDLLKALAAQPPPATPPGIGREIWRLIAARQLEDRDLFAELHALFTSWRAISVALAIASGVGLAVGQVGPRLDESTRQTRAALYLEVFAPQAPDSPAKLLAYKK